MRDENKIEIIYWQVTCTKELTVRYEGTVVELKQKLEILINGQAVSIKRLPVTVGKVQVKQVSSTMVMGKMTRTKHYVNLY
jgi:archaellum component FlaF (FlaF/FlaG flagellin family)